MTDQILAIQELHSYLTTLMHLSPYTYMHNYDAINNVKEERLTQMITELKCTLQDKTFLYQTVEDIGLLIATLNRIKQSIPNSINEIEVAMYKLMKIGINPLIIT